MGKISPLKSIRVKCVECSGGSAREVAKCTISDCALWALRFGKRPETVARMTEKRKKRELSRTLATGGAEDVL